MLAVLVGVGSPDAKAAFDSDKQLEAMTLKSSAVRYRLTLREAVDMALENFPTIQSAQARLQAAKADVSLARTAYLPHFNLVMQEMRTSHNLVTGTVMPQANTFDAIPIQSGTPDGNSMRSIWASNQAANFNWLLWDFGLRHANVEVAKADAQLARANLNLTKLDAAYSAAEAYLNAVACEQRIRAAQATVDRMQADVVTVRALVDRGMQPGVDAARADYDLSRAKIALIRTVRATELARIDLAERLGVAGAQITVVCEPLITGSQRYTLRAPASLAAHPLALSRTAAINSWSAKVKAIQKEYYPHLWLNSAVWGRGSSLTGAAKPVWDGVMPQVCNYMAGLSLSFPVIDYFPIKFRKQAALSQEHAQIADFDLAMQILEQKNARARVLMTEAKQIATETPHLVQAAKENEIKMVERYRAGLTNMVAVAEAERILAEAEVEDAVSWVDVWHSILAMGYVQGDLQPFLGLVAASEGAKK